MAQKSGFTSSRSRCLKLSHAPPLCLEVAGNFECGKLAREAEAGRLVTGYGRLRHESQHFSTPLKQPPDAHPPPPPGFMVNGEVISTSLGLSLRTRFGQWDGSKYKAKAWDVFMGLALPSPASVIVMKRTPSCSCFLFRLGSKRTHIGKT